MVFEKGVDLWIKTLITSLLVYEELQMQMNSHLHLQFFS